eukprot:2768856-Rhodomonas_salina.1
MASVSTAGALPVHISSRAAAEELARLNILSKYLFFFTSMGIICAINNADLAPSCSSLAPNSPPISRKAEYCRGLGSFT